MLNFEDTIRAVESIEQASYGWANQAALRDEGSQYLYSPRKADKWGGSEEMKRSILTACQSLKDWAGVLERETQASDNPA